MKLFQNISRMTWTFFDTEFSFSSFALKFKHHILTFPDLNSPFTIIFYKTRNSVYSIQKYISQWCVENIKIYDGQFTQFSRFYFYRGMIPSEIFFVFVYAQKLFHFCFSRPSYFLYVCLIKKKKYFLWNYFRRSNKDKLKFILGSN